jgi:hypothetical protein
MVNFSHCLIKHHDMTTYRGMDVYIHVFLFLKLDGASGQLHVRLFYSLWKIP